MKSALILAVTVLGLSASAFAQTLDQSASPGPHDPNPPMNTPDLLLPPPCAPTPNLAVAGATVKPAATTSVTSAGVVPTASGDTQCSANTTPQSAALPSDRPLSP